MLDLVDQRYQQHNVDYSVTFFSHFDFFTRRWILQTLLKPTSGVGTRLCPMYIDLWVHLGPCFSIGAEYVHKQMEYFIGCDSSIAFDGQELISPSYANRNKRMGHCKWLIRARCCAYPINANNVASPFPQL